MKYSIPDIETCSSGHCDFHFPQCKRYELEKLVKSFKILSNTPFIKKLLLLVE